MSHSSVRETEEHEPLAKALELDDLSDHGELGPALHKMPVAHVRSGLNADAGNSVAKVDLGHSRRLHSTRIASGLHSKADVSVRFASS